MGQSSNSVISTMASIQIMCHKRSTCHHHILFLAVVLANTVLADTCSGNVNSGSENERYKACKACIANQTNTSNVKACVCRIKRTAKKGNTADCKRPSSDGQTPQQLLSSSGSVSRSGSGSSSGSKSRSKSSRSRSSRSRSRGSDPRYKYCNWYYCVDQEESCSDKQPTSAASACREATGNDDEDWDDEEIPEEEATEIDGMVIMIAVVVAVVCVVGGLCYIAWKFLTKNRRSER